MLAGKMGLYRPNNVKIENGLKYASMIASNNVAVPQSSSLHQHAKAQTIQTGSSHSPEQNAEQSPSDVLTGIQSNITIPKRIWVRGLSTFDRGDCDSDEVLAVDGTADRHLDGV